MKPTQIVSVVSFVSIMSTMVLGSAFVLSCTSKDSGPDRADQHSGPDEPPSREPATEPLAARVVEHYVVQAHTRYQDTLAAVDELQAAFDAFLAAPSPESHEAAKQAWIHAHSVYSHAEVFRFGNPNVDAWESNVNAWPVDEGFLDYVSPHYAASAGNPHALENLIGSRDYPLTDESIEEAREGKDPKKARTKKFADAEANVATGFHAMEFLLWGQDLNETPTSAGQRPHTDFVQGEGCTHANCDRRAEYLMHTARIMRRDLLLMIDDWDPKKPTRYSKTFAELPVPERLDRMITGMGSLSFGELAGERLRVALLASDQEDEQNCFSDTTHLAIFHNAKSIQSLYLGRHERSNGTTVTGPSLHDLVAKADPELAGRLEAQLRVTLERAQALVDAAEAGEPFDRMIAPDNDAGRQRISDLIDALRVQTESIEAIHARIDELAKL